MEEVSAPTCTYVGFEDIYTYSTDPYIGHGFLSRKIHGPDNITHLEGRAMAKEE